MEANEAVKKPRKPREPRSNVPIVGLQQLLKKKFTFIDNVPEKLAKSLGRIPKGFVMTVFGRSGAGKSSFLYDVLTGLSPVGNTLYLALEEGISATTQMQALRRLTLELHGGKILFTNHKMTWAELMKKLKQKKSPTIIVIDSLKYWRITYDQYVELKETFPGKIFIFIAHAGGKNKPKGAVAEDILYDGDIKVQVVKRIAFVTTRYRIDNIGEQAYVIHEDAAKKMWGKKYKKMLTHEGYEI